MRLAEEGGFEIDAGYAVQYALAQAPAVEVGDIAPKRRLAVGTTVEIVEEDLRDFDLRSTAEIFDVNDAHCFHPLLGQWKTRPLRVPRDLKSGPGLLCKHPISIVVLTGHLAEDGHALWREVSLPRDVGRMRLPASRHAQTAIQARL